MPTPSADDGTRAWLRAVVWSGTLALVLSGVLQAVFPRQMGMLPPGFRTPVLALELARSPAELEEMFGLPRSEQRAQWVAQVDRGNVLDFAFIPVYCFFLYACAQAFAPVRPRVARSALVLCVLAAIGDAVENVFLFRITERLGVEYASDVLGLIAFTWLKWFSLVGCLALLSPSMRARGRWGAVSGWVGLASLLFALIAVVIRGVAAELMLLAITLGIVTMWIEAIRSRRGMPGSG